VHHCCQVVTAIRRTHNPRARRRTDSRLHLERILAEHMRTAMQTDQTVWLLATAVHSIAARAGTAARATVAHIRRTCSSPPATTAT
jgi:hypothetical protein